MNRRDELQAVAHVACQAGIFCGMSLFASVAALFAMWAHLIVPSIFTMIMSTLFAAFAMAEALISSKMFDAYRRMIDDLAPDPSRKPVAVRDEDVSPCP